MVLVASYSDLGEEGRSHPRQHDMGSQDGVNGPRHLPQGDWLNFSIYVIHSFNFGDFISIHSFIPAISIAPLQVYHLLLRGAPDYSRDTLSEFHAEAHRQLQVKDLPKVPTRRLERESNPRPSG